MKILMLSGSLFPAQTGGVDNAVYWWAKGLVDQKVDVNILTTDFGIKDTSLVRNKFIETDYGRVCYVSISDNMFPIKWYLKSIPVLFKFKGIIHFHSLTYCFPFLFLVPFLKQKIVWSIHGELDPWARKSGRVFLKNWAWAMYRRMQRKIIFHTTCDAEEQYIKEVIGETAKIIKIPVGMVLPPRFTKSSTEKYLSYIGRIQEKKAIENLIQALHLSNTFQVSAYTLKIAGDCENAYGEQLKELVHELSLEHKVSFVGHVAGEQKEQFLADSYFNFMPSHTENFGIVVAEALAQGTPAVASTGTPWSILEENKAGFWVNNDPTTLAKVIDKIIDMKESEYSTMSAASLELAKNHLEISKNIKNWLANYQSLPS